MAGLVQINSVAYRCGYFYNAYLEKDVTLNNGYNCSHPENTEAPDCCHTFACPVAREAGYEDMLELDPDLAGEYKDEHQRNGFIESDWMVYEEVADAN